MHRLSHLEAGPAGSVKAGAAARRGSLDGPVAHAGITIPKAGPLAGLSATLISLPEGPG
jgi:hypothetical protein